MNKRRRIKKAGREVYEARFAPKRTMEFDQPKKAVSDWTEKELRELGDWDFISERMRETVRKNDRIRQGIQRRY